MLVCTVCVKGSGGVCGDVLHGVEVDADLDVAVGHDEGSAAKVMYAAILIGDNNIAGGVGILVEAPYGDLQLYACAGLADCHAVTGCGNVEPAVGAVGSVKIDVAVDVEFDADTDREVRHGEGAVSSYRNGDAGVAGLEYGGNVVEVCAVGAAGDLHLCTNIGRACFLSVNGNAQVAFLGHDLGNAEYGTGGGLDGGNDGNGAVGHGEGVLFYVNGLVEVVVVDSQILHGVVCIGSDAESDSVTGLCGADLGVADLGDDLGIGSVNIDVVALVGVIVGVNLEGSAYSDGEGGHYELTVLNCHGVSVLVVGDSDGVEHEAGCRNGLYSDQAACGGRADNCAVDHCADSAVGRSVNSDLGDDSLREGDIDAYGEGGHHELVALNSDGSVGVADLGDADLRESIAGVGGGYYLDSLAGNGGICHVTVHNQGEVAVGGSLADQVIGGRATDDSGGRAGAGAGSDGGAGGYQTGHGYVQHFAYKEVTKIGSVIQCLYLPFNSIVVQTVVRADDVVCTVTAAHHVSHDGGVIGTCNSGVGGGQNESLASGNGVEAGQIVELEDLVGIGLVAQAPVIVDTGNSLAGLDGVVYQIVAGIVTGGNGGGCTGNGTGSTGNSACHRRGSGGSGCAYAAAFKIGGSCIGYRQNYLGAYAHLAELCLTGKTIEGHDQVFVGIEVHTDVLTQLQNCVTAVKGNGGDLCVGRCGSSKCGAQGNQHDHCQQ